MIHFFPHCCEYEMRCQSDTSVSVLKLPSVWSESKILIGIHFYKNVLDSSLQPLPLSFWSHLTLTHRIIIQLKTNIYKIHNTVQIMVQYHH